ncbi:MAG TPA: hypothetical protein VFG39_09520 [Balneolaceae bacterium]|nr:hypothetical protein [Balneolaceae bacterium]
MKVAIRKLSTRPKNISVHRLSNSALAVCGEIDRQEAVAVRLTSHVCRLGTWLNYITLFQKLWPLSSLNKSFTLFANQYRIYEVMNGKKGNLIGFAHEKRLSFKEKVDFFTDEKRKEPVFSVRAEKVLDFHGRFIVSNADNQPIGTIRKAFKKSLLRSTWQIEDNGEVAAVIQERSAAMALFRRAWNFIPVLSNFPFIFKYHFDFVHPQLNHVLASHSKTLLWRDHYRLDIADESLLKKIGWQTLVAQAVLLDALQGR